MSTRSFHHKNRHGCLTCKQRRKRCDLHKPFCGACQRLGLRCSYQSLLYPATAQIDDRFRNVQDPTQFVNSLHRALASQPRLFEATDFELASDYLQRDRRACISIPGVAALSHLDFFALTPQYPYLLHGVLAASALYMVSSQTSSDTTVSDHYKNRALLHQRYALSSYIRSLSSIDADSCKFIFGFSIILAGLQLAFCSSAPVDGGSDEARATQHTEKLLDIFHLMQGAVAVAGEASKWIPACRSEPLLLPIQTMLQNADSGIDSGLDTALDALAAHIVRTQHQNAQSGLHAAQHSNEVTVCLSALRYLRGVFCCLSKGEPQNFKAIVGWPAFVDRSYVQMIKSRQPSALIVLAFYGVALHTLRTTWWLQHIGTRLVMEIDRILRMDGAEEWYAFSAWTISQVLHSEMYPLPATSTNKVSLASVEPEKRPSGPFEAAYNYICSVDSLGEAETVSVRDDG